MIKHKLLQDLIENRLSTHKEVKLSINTALIPSNSPFKTKLRRVTIVDRGPLIPIRILTDGQELDADLKQLIDSYKDKLIVNYE